MTKGFGGRRLLVAAVAVVLVGLLQVAGWMSARQVARPADVIGLVQSVSYAPYIDKPDTEGNNPEMRARIAQDTALLARITRQVRTYSISLPVDREIIAAAAAAGLKVMLGVWLDRDEARNAREMDAAVEMVRAYPATIHALIVGNETLLREDRSVDQLVAAIREMRKRTRDSLPISTGETWDQWLLHPELSSAVDFVAAHILPYWEGLPADQVVDNALARYDSLRAAFPGKPVMVAEFGWPSRGYNDRAAEPDVVTQAEILRVFVERAERQGLSYNLFEAFDQPWKTMEGSVGPYWGLFRADRTPKFPLQGLVEETYREPAIAAVVIGALLSIAALWRRRVRVREALSVAVVANALGVAAGLALTYPLDAYLNLGAILGWAMGLILMLLLAMVLLSKVGEIAEVALGHRPTRLLTPATAATRSGGAGGEAGAGSSDGHPVEIDPAHGVLPKVSIHIPAYREEPDMLIRTLESVAALRYPDFEVLVIVNNTPEEALWRPVEEACARLGSRFRFVFLPKVEGFKAGALNAAMPQMAEDARIIALIDADYVVDPDWLRDLVPAFANERVALVQAPQDHRDAHDSLFKSFMNDEYAGFFDIGMVQRNEDDAIITHGTMLLIRRDAFEAVGGWATDTIVEDTELGLRLMEGGYSAVYTNRRYGWGILPDDFRAYKAQRRRWAYGAVQIIRKHWRFMLPWAPGLTLAQKARFVTGWAVWLSDALGVAVAILSVLWVPVVLIIGTHLPLTALLTPAIAAVLVHLIHAVLLYRLRVRVSPLRSLRAAIAAMSLQVTVAAAVFQALTGDRLTFQRTDKGGAARRRRTVKPVNRTETILGLLLLTSAVVVWATNTRSVDELTIYALSLAVMSLPPLAAPLMGWIERHSARKAQDQAVVEASPGAEPGAEPAAGRPAAG